jgi:deoxyribose-phosphate aldolase
MRVPPVDRVGLEERAASLFKRSIKKASKVAGLRLVVSMTDLTTLEGRDSPGKVSALCGKALRPLPSDPTVGPVAAVCVYPNLVAVAKRRLAATSVKVASVATGFPSGQVPLDAKLAEVRHAVEDGADEIDMVIDRGAFLAGEHGKVFDEIARVKEACGTAHLKTILETGELGPYDHVRKACRIALLAGTDFLKTSTGKVTPAATPAMGLLLLEAARDWFAETGKRVGVKVAGGIRTSKEALGYLVLVKETVGDEWLTPELFRFGASTLLNDVLMQIEKERTGRYQSDEDFSKD